MRLVGDAGLPHSCVVSPYWGLGGAAGPFLWPASTVSLSSPSEPFLRASPHPLALLILQIKALGEIRQYEI